MFLFRHSMLINKAAVSAIVEHFLEIKGFHLISTD